MDAHKTGLAATGPNSASKNRRYAGLRQPFVDQRELGAIGTRHSIGLEHFADRRSVAIRRDRRILCGDTSASEQNHDDRSRRAVSANSAKILRTSWSTDAAEQWRRSAIICRGARRRFSDGGGGSVIGLFCLAPMANPT